MRRPRAESESSTEKIKTQTKRLLLRSLRRGNLCVALALFALRTFYAIRFIHRNSYRFKSDFPLLVSQAVFVVLFFRAGFKCLSSPVGLLLQLTN